MVRTTNERLQGRPSLDGDGLSGFRRAPLELLQAFFEKMFVAIQVAGILAGLTSIIN
jgi:hypothetical protein